ncbi:MAG: hypothetical protein R2856_08400 [Caldilineaceae bacterium]
MQLLKSGVTTTAHSHNPRTLGNWWGWRQTAEAIRAYVDAGARGLHPPLVDQNQLVYAERSRFLQKSFSLVTSWPSCFSPPSPSPK